MRKLYFLNYKNFMLIETCDKFNFGRSLTNRVVRIAELRRNDLLLHSENTHREEFLAVTITLNFFLREEKESTRCCRPPMKMSVLTVESSKYLAAKIKTNRDSIAARNDRVSGALSGSLSDRAMYRYLI